MPILDYRERSTTSCPSSPRHRRPGYTSTTNRAVFRRAHDRLANEPTRDLSVRAHPYYSRFNVSAKRNSWNFARLLSYERNKGGRRGGGGEGPRSCETSRHPARDTISRFLHFKVSRSAVLFFAGKLTLPGHSIAARRRSFCAESYSLPATREKKT